MAPETQALLDEAVKLPEAERLLLAECLLESLSPDKNLTDEELFAELEKRRAEVEQGTVRSIPWSEVRLEEGVVAMSPRLVELHPLAVRELQAAFRTYNRRSPATARRFQEAVARVV
jgi:putative addiction module component (TIGR02574 family)